MRTTLVKLQKTIQEVEVQAAQLKDKKLLILESSTKARKPGKQVCRIRGTFRQSQIQVLVRHLDEQTMLAVADILEQSPSTGKYEILKNALIERFSDSIEKQMRILLNSALRKNFPYFLERCAH